MQAVSPSALALRPVIAAVIVTTLLAALGLQIGLTAVSAQAEPRPRGQAPTTPPASLDDLKQREQELEGLRTEQKKALENEAKLKREIEAIGDDRRKFNQQIIDTAARVVNLEERIGKTKERMGPLDDSERALRASLDRRRDVIAEILAALQRIGRQPPPALVIK